MDTTQSAASVSQKRTLVGTWRKSDTTWMLGLYGTAIGAGVLFLPINAGVGGLLPLIIMAIIAFPMTFFAHRGLCRFVLSGKNPGEDITEVVEEHFGIGTGKLITLLYFFAIYPILLVYGVAITNTVDSFIVNQIHLPSPPRAILSLILIAGLMIIVRFGENFMVKAVSVLVFPFVAVLTLLALYLIPHWSGAIFESLSVEGNGVGQGMLMTLWLVIPVMVFAFNHSPIISAFAVAKREEYGNAAEEKCSRILVYSHILMVLTVMFFVFSCVLSLSPADLMAAKAQNISILSYLANRLNTPIIAYVAPIIAFVAISTSFFGHYMGAREGFNRMVIKSLYRKGKTVHPDKLNRITAFFMLVSTWIVATLNPSILGMIENLGGPIIAMLLFLMPMYAINKVPAMHKYRGDISNIFVIIMGLISISAILYSLLG
ncbi:HAAAP family serine/threonine permease [Candidatus Fukatsuia symbiotica]|uniref:HAAAP family serine/threonine permease n=1 Tax=Candidatus Fukatsuia symbiotica TaxID=1878942 RepID=A0A2U8I2G1_9GAMM|nr:HAAAP family serine/threonine permease [Candidatus Fukatsuia symbiotica]AWK13276.1 HAAAP family serine/threonine permease [Candidatus Fukatsuia symbiotica]MEA9444148.1 HAAAP family serine/threonine permease [Candidatus Fukatsuia symbiotica]